MQKTNDDGARGAKRMQEVTSKPGRRQVQARASAAFYLHWTVVLHKPSTVGTAERASQFLLIYHIYQPSTLMACPCQSYPLATLPLALDPPACLPENPSLCPQNPSKNPTPTHRAPTPELATGQHGVCVISYNWSTPPGCNDQAGNPSLLSNMLGK